MIEPIEYELQLPNTLTGQKLAKTIGRILKHTYQARRLRIEQSKEMLTVRAKVSKEHLHAIRGAVRMTCTAKGILAELHRDADRDPATEMADLRRPSAGQKIGR